MTMPDEGDDPAADSISSSVVHEAKITGISPARTGGSDRNVERPRQKSSARNEVTPGTAASTANGADTSTRSAASTAVAGNRSAQQQQRHSTPATRRRKKV